MVADEPSRLMVVVSVTALPCGVFSKKSFSEQPMMTELIRAMAKIRLGGVFFILVYSLSDLAAKIYIHLEKEHLPQ